MAEFTIELRTLVVREVPPALAMLDQVKCGEIIDAEVGALPGDPLGRIIAGEGEQLLWLHGRDLRRCVIPETAPCAPMSAEERALQDRVQAERQRLDAAVKAVTKASRFVDLAAALSTNGQFRGGAWRGHLGEILGAEMSVLEEADARGEAGPMQLEGTKVRVLASLAAEKARTEASAEELARIAAAREAKEAELAALVVQLAGGPAGVPAVNTVPARLRPRGRARPPVAAARPSTSVRPPAGQRASAAAALSAIAILGHSVDELAEAIARPLQGDTPA